MAHKYKEPENRVKNLIEQFGCERSWKLLSNA
jgi:hypothetical protein